MDHTTIPQDHVPGLCAYFDRGQSCLFDFLLPHTVAAPFLKSDEILLASKFWVVFEDLDEDLVGIRHHDQPSIIFVAVVEIDQPLHAHLVGLVCSVLVQMVPAITGQPFRIIFERSVCAESIKARDQLQFSQ